MLSSKDVAIIIPTFDREKDVERTLSFLPKHNVGKVFIVDQSKNDNIKKVVKKYSKKLNLEYIHSEIPSLSIAQNLGIKKAKKNYKIILIIDDDVDLLNNYIKELVKIYEDPKVMAVGGALKGFNTGKNVRYNFNSFKNKLSNFIFKIFFLPYKTNNKSLVKGPYGITAPPVIRYDIKDAEWIPGSNESFRSKVFEWYQFPETLEYTLVEDIDSTYSVFKKYGVGSLVRTPKCLAIHNHSQTARYGNKKRIFTNHEDHFYFYYRHFHTKIGTLKLIWSLTGIIIGNLVRFLAKPSKDKLLHFKYNLQAITYCYLNRENIKNKKFRGFLNKDGTIRF